MAYKAKEHLPLLIYGLCIAPICIASLAGIGTVFSYELAALVSMFAGMLLVVGLVTHWRYS